MTLLTPIHPQNIEGGGGGEWGEGWRREESKPIVQGEHKSGCHATDKKSEIEVKWLAISSSSTRHQSSSISPNRSLEVRERQRERERERERIKRLGGALCRHRKTVSKDAIRETAAVEIGVQEAWEG